MFQSHGIVNNLTALNVNTETMFRVYEQCKLDNQILSKTFTIFDKYCESVRILKKKLK